MSCKINYEKINEWKIDNDHINQMYPYLYKKNEYGGKFNICTNSKKTTNLVKSNEGAESSVDTPDAIINWHTHPFSCYIAEQTVFGWPSGEDFRESIIYGLRGSACHIVCAVEGIYLIQPNPCVVTSLIDIAKYVPKSKYGKIYSMISNKNSWDSFIRGFIILTIEYIFKSLHGYRNISFIKHNIDLQVVDFLLFCNQFSLNNIFSNNRVSSGIINCNKITDQNDGSIYNYDFIDYIKKFDNKTNSYLIDRHGHVKESNVKYINILKNGGLQLLQNINLGVDCSIPHTKLHSPKIFKVKFFPNVVTFDNINWIDYNNLTFQQKIYFIQNQIGNKNCNIKLEPNQTITFLLFDMQGSCEFDDLKKHINHHFTSSNFGTSTGDYLIIGSHQCPYCTKAIDRANDLGIELNVEMYDTIKEAIEKASEKAGISVKTIPAYFKNNIYSSEPLF